MRDLPNLEKFKKILSSSEEILIATGANSDFDILAASLAFYLSLLKMGKKVTIVSPKEPVVEDASLIGVDKIASSLEDRKLVISVRDALGSVEKVTYNLEGDKLNIVVHPLAGTKSLSQDKIEFSYSEPHFDLVILFEVPDWALLENLYTQGKDMYSKIQKLAIGKTYSIINADLAIIEPSLSLSEMTSLLISRLKMPIDKDIGDNLFNGMRWITKGFEIPPATAETFELASFCLKASGYSQSDWEKGAFVSNEEIPSSVSADLQKIEDENVDNKVELEAVEPEPDWFTPKIYKSSKSSS